MDQLNRDLLELVGSLDEESIDCLIVGGIHEFPPSP